MKLRMVMLFGVGAAAATWMGACSKQAGIFCTAQHGNFATKWTLKSGTGPCSAVKGEIMGLQKFNPEVEGKKLPDYDRAILAIRSAVHGNGVVTGIVVDETNGVTVPREEASGNTNEVNAVGEFEDPLPDKDGICTAPTFNEARQEWVAAPNPDAGPDLAPATTIAYQWSNVKVYVTEAAPGAQFTADLTYELDGCTAEYSVMGLSPALSCDDGNGAPDVSLCVPQFPPRINPDFKYKCDPVLLMCVLDGDTLPVLK